MVGTGRLQILLALFLLVLASDQAEAKRRHFTFTTDTAFNIADSPRLIVDNPVGDVVVMPGPDSLIRVTQQIVIPASDSAHAETFLEDIEVDYVVRPSRLTIETRRRKSKRERSLFGGLLGLHDPGRGRVDLEIEVPVAADLEVWTTSGTIAVHGIRGDHHLASTSGDQDLSSLHGRVHVECTSGDVLLEEARADVMVTATSGDLRLRHVEGDTRLATSSGEVRARNVQGALEVTASSGDLTIEGLEGALSARTSSGDLEVQQRGGDVEIRTSSGDMNVTAEVAEAHRYRFQTGSGDVELLLDVLHGADFNIETGSGSVSDELGIDWASRRRRRVGQLGDGGAQIDITTGSGDIQLGGKP